MTSSPSCNSGNASNGAPEVPLPSEEVERYSRQLLLPAFGVSSQQRLKNSRLLIVGAGGLGCPAALYLSGAGVGVLGFVDIPGETVAASNLHRQIAHTTAGAAQGLLKIDSVKAAVQALNPRVHVQLHESFTGSNAVELVRLYELVLDCTDNVAARYLVSDACAAAGVPLVSGAALGLDGQLTVLCGGGACYRCVFPAPPPPNCVGSCDAAGVLGPVPGTIGTLMALEAIKIAGAVRGTQPLIGRLLLFDGANANFRTVRLRGRSAQCVACGDADRIDVATFDYARFATGGARAKMPQLDDKRRISVEQLADLREKRHRGETDFVLLDVRPAVQYEMCALDESKSVPLDRLDDAAVEELREQRRRVVVLCRRGNSSQTACRKLLDAGIADTVDVRGGLQAWHAQVDSSFPLY